MAYPSIPRPKKFQKGSFNKEYIFEQNSLLISRALLRSHFTIAPFGSFNKMYLVFAPQLGAHPNFSSFSVFFYDKINNEEYKKVSETSNTLNIIHNSKNIFRSSSLDRLSFSSYKFNFFVFLFPRRARDKLKKEKLLIVSPLII